MKRILVVLTLFLASSLAFPFRSFAQTPTPGPWYSQNPQQFHDRVFGTPLAPVPENEIFGERYTYAQINWIINSLANIFSLDFSDLNKLQDIVHNMLVKNQIPSSQEFASVGLPGLYLSSISDLYSNPPASGVDTVQQTMAKLNIVPEVHAQGQGYTSLTAFSFLWQASRNTAYFVMVILLIAAGFLIMFRVKVNPQTVVSLQLMIPKVIITLLLVTFSYAIAGLVLDLIYLILGAIFIALQTSGVLPSSTQALKYFTGGNFAWVVAYFVVPSILILFGVALITLVLGPVGAAVGLGPLGLLPGAIAAVITIVIAIAICWILFKVWWMLLKTYITIVFLIITGPWQIMLGLLPGQAGFGSWFRNLIANASVFVAVPVMILFTMVLWSPFYGLFVQFGNAVGGIAKDALVPFGGALQSGTGNYPILPLVGGGGPIFNYVIGFAGLALTPKIADIIRDSLKIPPFKYGNAIGQPIGFVVNKPLDIYSNVAQARAKLAPDVQTNAANTTLSQFFQSLKINSR